MNPILLGRVLKEELKKTTTADPDGAANLEKEKIFETNYAQWMLGQPLEEDAYLLTPDHLTDDHGLISFFRKGTGTDQQKAVFQQLSDGLRKRISSHEKDNWLAETVLQELNTLLKSGGIPSTGARPELDSLHKEILKNCQAKLSAVAINRLYLQAIFPDWILKVWDTLPVSMVHKWIHAHPEIDHNALCLSGGGIRSATFGLGVLQGLADTGLLPKLQYLSTVSGGGYIGSWLSTWTAREDFKKVVATLGQNPIGSEKTKG